METAQRFSLGTLSSGVVTRAPSEVKLSVHGRGIFAHIIMEFSFEFDDASAARLFTVDRPWNAVLSRAAVNHEPLQQQPVQEPSKILPFPLKGPAEEALQDGSIEVVCLFFEAGQSLRTVTLEFVMALDVLWHRSSLSFVTPTDSVGVQVDISWELSGLPGARLECGGAASESRFASLESSLRNWTETLPLRRGEEFSVALALDEKKAASLCLYSDAEERGCGAVVVVAPVRPQLLRRPIRLAVVVEIRNPQEGLLTRELVDQLTGTLNSKDQIAIFFMGSSVTRKVLDWSDAGNLSEEAMAKLLDPSLMGRAQFFWESFQRAFSDCEGATHLMLSSPGPKQPAPEDLRAPLPLFAFATGNKPNASTLGDFVERSGGFLSENSIDGISSFLQRVNIRLSPPLLRDFRLDGWGLEELNPPGLTQVYTDKPTLVMGRYEGLLPQTVTLCGFSPAGQKLAQRVRVEKFSQFDLLPILNQRLQLDDQRDKTIRAYWTGEALFLAEVTRPVSIAELFLVEEPEKEVSSGLDGPPSIDIVSSAVTLDDGFFGAPTDATVDDDFFSGAAEQTVDDDFFSGAASEEPVLDDLFMGSDDSIRDFFDESGVDQTPTFLDEDPVSEASLTSPEEDPFAALSFEGPDSGSGESTLQAEPTAADPSSSVEDDLTSGPVGPQSEEDLSESSLEFDSQERVEEPEPRSFATERATVAVANPFPAWVRHLSDLDRESMSAWLEACPIDTLALALVDTDETLANTFLETMGERRRQAVLTQMEWGKLLPSEERLEAGRSLEQRLASVT